MTSFVMALPVLLPILVSNAIKEKLYKVDSWLMACIPELVTLCCSLFFIQKYILIYHIFKARPTNHMIATLSVIKSYTWFRVWSCTKQPESRDRRDEWLIIKPCAFKNCKTPRPNSSFIFFFKMLQDRVCRSWIDIPAYIYICTYLQELDWHPCKRANHFFHVFQWKNKY